MCLRDDPVPLLRRWQFAPFADQLLALRRWHLLEALEALVQALALRRRQLAEFAFIGTHLPALFGRHLLPTGDAFADLLPPRRWQGDPVLCFLEHVRLPLRRQLVPLLLQRCQYLALGRIEARPGTRCRRRRLGLRGWRRCGNCLRTQRGERGDEHGGQQEDDRVQTVAHGQWVAGCLSLAASHA